jgi:hypothetical protein
MALNRTALSVMLAAALLDVVPPNAARSALATWLPRPFPKSDVLLVAQGCGPGLHRDRYGYCVPNGPWSCRPRARRAIVLVHMAADVCQWDITLHRLPGMGRLRDRRPEVLHLRR